MPFLIVGKKFFYAIPHASNLTSCIMFWDIIAQGYTRFLNEWCNFTEDSYKYDQVHIAFLALLTFIDKQVDRIREEIRDNEKSPLFNFIPGIERINDEEAFHIKCKEWTTVFGTQI